VKRDALPVERMNPPLFLRVQMYDNFILMQKNDAIFNCYCNHFINNLFFVLKIMESCYHELS